MTSRLRDKAGAAEYLNTRVAREIRRLLLGDGSADRARLRGPRPWPRPRRSAVAAAFTVPLLHANAIDWEMDPAETIPAEGGNIRASTIAYRELAQAGCHGLHLIHHQHDRLVLQHLRLRDEVKALRASLLVTHSEPTPTPTRQPRLPMAGLSGISGVRGL